MKLRLVKVPQHRQRQQEQRGSSSPLSPFIKGKKSKTRFRISKKKLSSISMICVVIGFAILFFLLNIQQLLKTSTHDVQYLNLHHHEKDVSLSSSTTVSFSSFSSGGFIVSNTTIEPIPTSSHMGNIDIQSVRGLLPNNNTENSITNLQKECPKSMLPSSDVLNSIYKSSRRELSQTSSSYNRYSDQVGLITLVLNRKQKELSNLIQSVRRRGSWLGPIIVVTDIEKVVLALSNQNNNNKNNNLTTTNLNLYNVHVIQIYPQTQYQNQLKQRLMKFKRLKTEFFDLLPNHLNHLEYLLYIDADILIGNSIVNFLDRVLPMFDNNNNNNKSTQNSSTAGGGEVVNWLLFKEQGYHPAGQQKQGDGDDVVTGQVKQQSGHQNIFFHTGVMLIHRQSSKECLKKWKYQFDTDQFGSDQAALKDMLYNVQNNIIDDNDNHHHNKQQGKKKCNIQQLPPNDLMMPNPSLAKNGQVSTFVHLTHVRIKRIYKTLANYKKCSLLVDDNIDMIGWNK